MLAMLSKEPVRKYELKNENQFVRPCSIGLLAKIQNVPYTAVFFSMPSVNSVHGQMKYNITF